MIRKILTTYALVICKIRGLSIGSEDVTSSGTTDNRK